MCPPIEDGNTPGPPRPNTPADVCFRGSLRKVDPNQPEEVVGRGVLESRQNGSTRQKVVHQPIELKYVPTPAPPWTKLMRCYVDGDVRAGYYGRTSFERWQRWLSAKE